ncbi:MAG: hypothetical protein GY940_38820, partial [bacterium]|nr:hypothetical protein [bacterium]
GTQNGLLFYGNQPDSPIIITDENGLTSRRIREILIDREQNIFVGTEWSLSQISPNLFKMYEETDGLPHEFVWGFEEDEENNAVMIACGDGIAQLDVKSGLLTSFDSTNLQLKGYSIRSITKYKKNTFLLGTRSHGIFRWFRQDRSNKHQLERIHPDANVFTAVKTVKDGTPVVWFGTTNGILKYDGKNFKTIHEGLKDKNVWTL